MRIALFTGNYNHIPDGVSLTLNRLVAYLVSEGVEVLVFGPTIENPPIQHAGDFMPVPSVSAPGRPEYRISLRFPAEHQKALEDFDPDIIHIATPDLLGRAALKQAERLSKPVVATYHTHFSSYLHYYKLGLLEDRLWSYLRKFYGRCQEVYVPSPAMVEILENHGLAGNLKIWERGVEVSRFRPELRDMEWRRALGLEEDEIVITFVSRLVWEKGLRIYADVVNTLRSRGLRARGLIVGDGPAREELESMMPNAVFTGHVKEGLGKAYASTDIFLFPSETETFGNVTLEAMASGVPAVCADAAGSRSLVKDGETGFLCEPRNTESFLHRTEQLAVDSQLRSTFGAAGVQRSHYYNWDAVLGRMMAYYNGIVERNR